MCLRHCALVWARQSLTFIALLTGLKVLGVDENVVVSLPLLDKDKRSQKKLMVDFCLGLLLRPT